MGLWIGRFWLMVGKKRTPDKELVRPLMRALAILHRGCSQAVIFAPCLSQVAVLGPLKSISASPNHALQHAVPAFRWETDPMLA